MKMQLEQVITTLAVATIGAGVASAIKTEKYGATKRVLKHLCIQRTFSPAAHLICFNRRVESPFIWFKCPNYLVVKLVLKHCSS